MCETKYISSIFASLPVSAQNNIVQISIKRSDNELFNTRLTMLTDKEAERVKNLFDYIEELRTCICTKFTVCDKHSSLRKIS